MCIRYRIAVISLVVLSSVPVSFGVNDTLGAAVAPRGAMLATRSGIDTKARIAPPSLGSPSRTVRPTSDDDDTVTAKKTLAVLLLILRDGPGAR
jgi:hypothetical protein